MRRIKTQTDRPTIDWVSLEEAYPYAEYGESENVLVTIDSGRIDFLFYDGGNWCYPDGRIYEWTKWGKVIAWSYLPIPYKGAENED